MHNDIVKRYQGESVGKIHIKQPIEHTFRDYECAAWSQSVVTATGIFDLFLAEQHTYPHEVYLKAELPTTITSDFFPALWCGVAVSSKPYDTRRDEGRPGRSFYKRIEIVDAVSGTNATPDGKEFDVFVRKEIWRDFIDHYRAQLAEAASYAQKCIAKWQEFGDGGEYLTDLKQMGYAGGELRKFTKLVNQLERYLGYLEGPNNQMWLKYYHDNNVWAQP